MLQFVNGVMHLSKKRGRVRKPLGCRRHRDISRDRVAQEGTSFLEFWTLLRKAANRQRVPCMRNLCAAHTMTQIAE